MAQIYSNISYGASPKQVVDIYEPANYNFANETGPDPKGVIVWIHGGGWQSNDKATDASNYACVGGSPDPKFQDKPQCAIMADQGFVVISANYDLLGPDPVPDPLPCLAPRGSGYYPTNINQIAELIKFLAIPGYATGINQPTWQLLNRYVGTYGLMITGGSAGGHLTITGTFAAAATTGYWPRGMLNSVGPMDLVLSPENPYGPVGQQLVDNYCQNNASNEIGASPWYQRNTYATYPNFTLLADPLQFQVKTRVCFWFNSNDTLVPPTSIVRFRDWILGQLGSGFVISTEVTEGVPVPGIEDHNVTTPQHEQVMPTAKQVFFAGPNYPNQQQKLRPTQGQIYPRPYIYRYPRQA